MKKTIGTMIVIVLLLGVYLFGVVNRESPTIGSIQDGQAYNSTTTDQGWVDSTRFRLIKTGDGTLGSVVITLSSATAFNLYDATTTVNGGIYGTTTLAKFGASATSGTYTFDVDFTKGLIVEFPTGQVTPASTTITWR